VLQAYEDYERYLLNDIARRERHVAKLPARYLDRLPKGCLAEEIARSKVCLKANQAFLSKVATAAAVSSYAPPARSIRQPQKGGANNPKQLRPASQMEKVKSALHQSCREWAAEGAAEREQTFTPVLDELERLLPVTAGNMDKQKVLFPGSGTGRLVLECAGRGYAAQGNEFSYFMLLTANYILNRCVVRTASAVFQACATPTNPCLTLYRASGRRQLAKSNSRLGSISRRTSSPRTT
jgi:carnosine N-methyltransferase